MPGKANHRGFGFVRRLPSRRYQASYIGPDAERHTAPATFQAKMDAEAWLAFEHGLVGSDTWTPPAARSVRAQHAVHAKTFGEYAATWLAGRDLKPRTRSHYASLLRRQLAPWQDVPVASIRPDMVRDWHAALDKGTPTLRVHAYSLLRAILATAVTDGLLPANPCHIRGAGTARRVHKIRPATLEELTALVEAMPLKYRCMVLLASWCGLRFGELTELRGKDVDLGSGVLRIRRGVVRVDGQAVVGTPKSAAGARDVAIPPHLLPALQTHLAEHAQRGREGLLFPSTAGAHLAPSSLYKVFYVAREVAGRPDLRWHDLRHTGAVLAASTGATLAELMGRLGHSTPGAALRYQHAAEGRDAQIAEALSALISKG